MPWDLKQGGSPVWKQAAPGRVWRLCWKDGHRAGDLPPPDSFVDLAMPGRANDDAAGARSLRGLGVWLALLVVALQAPSISIHHCHDGGSEDHHHIVWQKAGQPAQENTGDLAPSHGHRVVWGWDLHDPSGHDSVNEPGGDHCPAGVIQASQAPAEAVQPRDVACLPIISGCVVARNWAPPKGTLQLWENPIPVCPHSGPMVLRV